MTFIVHGVQRIELTVADILVSERFFVHGLGFAAAGRDEPDPAITRLLGAERIRQVRLRRGGQELWLQSFEPAGAAYPESSAADAVFQHFAMPVTDMEAAMAMLAPLAPVPISRGGPQHLPVRSGGATAWKFRDPDGHPLELIQFPDGHTDGIDHSAISVTDAARSIIFYRALGFARTAQQLNTGAQQDRLDGLDGVRVQVVALTPPQPTPHVELLAYEHPRGRPGTVLRPRDIAATRLVLQVSGLGPDATQTACGDRASLLHDPDAHALLLIEASPR